MYGSVLSPCDLALPVVVMVDFMMLTDTPSIRYVALIVFVAECAFCFSYFECLVWLRIKKYFDCAGFFQYGNIAWQQ